MSSISKQALLVENNTNFPDNNTGYITPSKLREFNVDLIDSTVNQATYSAEISVIQSDIAALEAFTASQQPSFAALNAFTASASQSLKLINDFTQSAAAELDSLSAWTGSWNDWTSSINEIRDNGTLQGYSTRLFFSGLVSASIVPNVNGTIASINIEQDGSKLGTASFDAFSSSVSASIIQLSSDISEVSESLYLFSQSIDLIDNTYATTGSNTFNGNQTVNGYVSASNGFYSGENTTALSVGEFSNVRFVNGLSYYNMQLIPLIGDIAFSRDGDSNIKVFTLAGAAGNNTTFQNNPVVFNDSVSSLTINAQSTAISGSGSYSVQASTISNTATNVTTAASSSFRGTLDITGQSSGDGRAILLGHSGSLVLGNSTTNTFYSAMNHISSSSANANTNLIFKNSTATADTIVSGSANIFVNPVAPTAGFKRYVGGTSNIFTNGNSVPQISGSMTWSPSMNGNIFSHTQTNAFTFRGPVSASVAGGINHNIFMGGTLNLGTSAANNFQRALAGATIVNNAVFGGTINMVAKDTDLTTAPVVAANLLFGSTLSLNLFSSSVSYTSNIQNGIVTVNNSFLPISGTAVAALTPRATLNTVYGHQHVINISGSNSGTTQTKTYYANILAGMFLSSSMTNNGDSNNILATGLLGNALVITGSSTSAAATAQFTPNDTQGTVIVGRFNDGTGTKASTAETVFAVGTGTSTTRKTGFLIDSGSNTIVDGSLTITGSVYGNVSASVINSSTASIDLSRGNYFTLTMAGTTNINVINARAGVTATLVINTSTAASASFSSNVKQPSGSFYAASPSGNVDIISFTAVDSNTVYAFPAQSFV